MHAAAAWVTVTVWPLTVMVPVRLVPLGLAAALKTKEPLPEPLLEVSVSQLVLVVAVQAQPVGDVTVTVLPVEAAAPTDGLAGAKV